MKTNTKQLATILLGLVVMILFFRGGEKEILSSPDGTKKLAAIAATKVGVTSQETLYLLELRGQNSLKALQTKTAFLKDLAMMKSGKAKAFDNATFSATFIGMPNWYSCSVDFPDLTGDKEFYIVNTVTWQYDFVSASSTTYADFWFDKPAVSSTYRVWGLAPFNVSEYTNELTL